MSPPVDNECERCGTFPGMVESPTDGYAICEQCFQAEVHLSENQQEINMISRVRNAIADGMINDAQVLLPTLNCSQEEYANEMIDEFINNTESRMECIGSSGGGMCRYFIYRHDDGELYTYWETGFDHNLTPLIGLTTYNAPMDMNGGRLSREPSFDNQDQNSPIIPTRPID